MKHDRIWNETGRRCCYCSLSIDRSEQTLDHVWPKSKGGTMANHNLIPACKMCNVKRGNKTPASSYVHPKFRKYVRKKEKRMGIRNEEGFIT